MGFAIYSVDEKQTENQLPSQSIFKEIRKVKGTQPANFLLKSFYWKDVYVRLIAEETANRKFKDCSLFHPLCILIKNCLLMVLFITQSIRVEALNIRVKLNIN